MRKVILLAMLITLVSGNAFARFGRFKPKPLSNAILRVMFTRTRRHLRDARKYCKQEGKEKKKFHKAVRTQLVVRALFAGRAVTKNRNKMIAAMTIRARNLAKEVIKANGGEVKLSRRERRKEKDDEKYAEGISAEDIDSETERILKKLDVKLPKVEELLDNFDKWMSETVRNLEKK